MANICWYQLRVKGDKKKINCLYYSMPVLNDTEIVFSNDDTIIFRGDCKWSLEAYCKPVLNDLTIDVDKYIDDEFNRIEFPLDYINYTLLDKSKLFDCEIEVFSEYEDYDTEFDFGERPRFQHFSKGNILENTSLSFEEVKNRASKLFGIEDIIHKYIYNAYDDTEDDDYEDDEDCYVPTSFPWEEELTNTELNGGIERAEKYKVGDSVKLIHEEDNEYDEYAIRVEHELGFVGYTSFDNISILMKQENTIGAEPHAKITEVIPLSKRSGRCKKPLVKIEVYLEK